MTELASTAAAPPLAKPDAVRQRSPLYFAWRRFTANKAALGAGIVLLIIILMAVFAPVITTTGPNEQLFLTNALNFPSAAHWFGVDDLGRDFFTRIVYGARVSLGIGFSAAFKPARANLIDVAKAAIASSCPNTTIFRFSSSCFSASRSSLETDFGGMRAILATMASISGTLITFLRLAGDCNC